MIDERLDQEEARREAAAAWVVRLAGDELEVADVVAFDAWLNATPLNAHAYDRALAVWLETGAAAHQLLARLREGRAAPPRIARRRMWAALAATAAAASLAVAILPAQQRSTGETYQTSTGERRTVRLADGSVVDLNAASRLTVSLGPHERRLALEEGEAVFDVTHDPSRPFVITAGDQLVRVVGTRFDVRRREGLLSVTVERGQVEVRPAEGAAGGAFRLHPGQRLDHRDGAAQARVSLADPQEVFSWRTGRLVLRERPLREVVAELNRQFAKPIRIDDPELADTPVTGVLVLDDQAAVIGRLAMLLRIKALPSAGEVRLQRE